MNPLFRKDVRENFRVALAGLAVFTFLIVLDFHSANSLLYNITHGQTNAEVSSLQPLLSGQFIGGATFFCAIFGAVLGFFQGRNEAHRDLWAFLIHRPVTRTQVFYGKAAAGLCLYFIAAGLPMLGMIGYVLLPGRIAAPFEPAMILPALGIFLTGIVYYFGGMLTALRQARWFGSRIFGLGAGIAASFAVFLMFEFWRVFAVLALLIACVGVAVWGAYQSGGFYRGQPRGGKVALTFSLGAGSYAVLMLVVGILVMLFSNWNDTQWQSYVMTDDGKMYIEKRQNGTGIVFDLDGKPLINPNTGRSFTSQEFNFRRTPELSAFSIAGRNSSGERSYHNVSTFFTLWNVSNQTLWYLDRHGKLIGFNGVTRRHAGDIVARNAAGDEPFLRFTPEWGNGYFNNWNPPTVLCTATTAYRVDLDNRKLTQLFTTGSNDSVIGFSEDAPSAKFIILTPGTVRLFNTAGKSLVSLPYSPGRDTYPQVTITTLNLNSRNPLTNRFAVWFHPDEQVNSKLNSKLPIHVTWLTGDNQVSQTRDFPTLQTPTEESLTESLMTAAMAPFATFLPFGESSKAEHLMCLVSFAVFGVIGWLLARRHRFTSGATIAWILFIGLCSLPGLLTFFFVQEFPRRETCPNCKKLRVVDREHCEHCAAEFPPPDKIGIEIFEPMASL